MAAAKSKSNPDPTPPSDWNYETSVSEIETILNSIEAGELPLDDVFAQFTGAIAQLQQCEAFLVDRQQQVDLLIETLAGTDF
jgi:exodeoxyribonuclease VII small subunit